MARRGAAGNLINFDAEAYWRDLNNAINKTTKELMVEVKALMVENLEQIDFKDNPVRLVGRDTTSDEDRKEAVINSILIERFHSIDTDVWSQTVKALTKNFKESHVGIYYEVGTGSKAKQSPEMYLDPAFINNNYGKPITSRSRHISYGGEGLGKWRDIGGNLRVTGSWKAGESKPGFRSYIGEDVKAYYWFQKAWKRIQSKAVNKYLSAIRKINPLNYLVVKKRFVLGRDRGGK